MKLQRRLLKCRLGWALVLIVGVSGATPSWSQAPSAETGEEGVSAVLPILDEGAELEHYLRIAALDNPALKAAFERWQAAVERIDQVEALPDPSVTYAYYIEEVETRVGSQRQRVGVAQPIPWLSKLRLRGEVASEAARAAEQRFEALKLELFFEVKEVYYELYYLGRALAITAENIALLEHLESVAQANLMAGAPVSGVIKAQVELGRLDDRRRTLEKLREPLTARLNEVLGRAAATSIPWPRDVPVRALVLDDSAVFSALGEHNPDLKRLDFEVDRDARATDLARAAYRPDFRVGLSWVDTSEALSPGVRESGKDPWMASVSVSLPIWRSKLRAGVREAERRHAASRKTREDSENALETRLELELFRFHDAERKIDLYRDTLIPLAEASLAVAQEGYEAGKEDFLEVIDAQRLLLDLQLSLERSVADREQSIAKLEMLTGRSLSTSSTDPELKPGARR